MATRANWFTADLAALDEEVDPFDAPVEEVGQAIDLRDPEGVLEARITVLLDQETNLDNCGIRCQIKDRPNTVCHACPVSRAGSEDPLGVLCRVGREQEKLLTELAVQRMRNEDEQVETRAQG